MKGQLVETRKVCFIEQRETCHVENGLANKYGSVDGKNRIVGIVNWGFRCSFCPFFFSILGLLEVFMFSCHSQWHPFTNLSRKSGPSMHPGTALSLMCPKPKHTQILRQIIQCVGADTSAECLVNTLNTKADIRVVFDKLMWGMLFTRPIAHRFQFCL